jgi:hypothetical protein
MMERAKMEVPHFIQSPDIRGRMPGNPGKVRPVFRVQLSNIRGAFSPVVHRDAILYKSGNREVTEFSVSKAGILVRVFQKIPGQKKARMVQAYGPDLCADAARRHLERDVTHSRARLTQRESPHARAMRAIPVPTGKAWKNSRHDGVGTILSWLDRAEARISDFYKNVESPKSRLRDSLPVSQGNPCWGEAAAISVRGRRSIFAGVSEARIVSDNSRIKRLLEMAGRQKEIARKSLENGDFLLCQTYEDMAESSRARARRLQALLDERKREREEKQIAIEMADFLEEPERDKEE